MMHWGSALITCSQDTEVQLCFRLAKMLVPPPRLMRAVGIASRPGPNGELRAIEVLVFPEAMRGAGEGHYPWDLEPGSLMTNGTVTGTVEVTSGRELSLSFKGASNKITVAPDAALVAFAPAERADLKVGERVFFSATKNSEGKLATSRVTVGKDGVAPPM